MYNFTDPRPELRRLDEFYGQIVALTTTDILPEMSFPQWNRVVKDVPRVEILQIDGETVTNEGETLVLTTGLGNQMRDAARSKRTLVGRLVNGIHPTNPEWNLVTLESLEPEERDEVITTLEAWAHGEE